MDGTSPAAQAAPQATDEAPAAPGRRRALECMLWAGTGVLWTIAGGVPRSALIGGAADAATLPATGAGGLTFAQVSDSHIGFNRDPNTDAPGTFRDAVARVRAAEARPAFLVHTGDVSHLSRPAEFDTAAAILRESGLETFVAPGEHDVIEDGGKEFFARFSPRARPGGWHSFDQGGVHFVALNNVSDLKAGGLGALGAEQLAWMQDDLRGRPDSQPVVVLAHIPLWMVYPEWGWGTQDGEQALAMLRRFGSVTVLNGHIHQVMQKVEGNVAFHTARSTAFPQPAPGTAPSPGPMKVPPGKLREVLGVAAVSYVPGRETLAIIDTPLGA